MLEFDVTLSENFNEQTSEFEEDVLTIQLEHSLVSMSKWESKHEKVFLSKKDKSTDEVFDYIKMMILTENVPENIIELMNEKQLEVVNAYLKKKNSATFFREDAVKTQSREEVTTELVYYWMFSYQIPIETENWPFNRLFNLIRIFALKNQKQERRSPKALAEERRALNEQRRAKYNTRG